MECKDTSKRQGKENMGKIYKEWPIMVNEKFQSSLFLLNVLRNAFHGRLSSLFIPSTLLQVKGVHLKLY